MNNELWHSQFLHICHCSVISLVTNLIKLGSFHMLFRLVCSSLGSGPIGINALLWSWRIHFQKFESKRSYFSRIQNG